MYIYPKRASKFKKQKRAELKGVKDILRIIFEILIPFSQYFTEKNENCNNFWNTTVLQPNLTDIYRTIHPTLVVYTFISNAHGISTKVCHMLGHKMS